MKTLSILTFSLAAALAVQAAPVVDNAKDLSEDTLKEIATPRQKASIDKYNKAREKAEKDREAAIKDAKEITIRNDKGAKQTIQRRHLNSMLPPCEREPEQPREPGNYEVRY